MSLIEAAMANPAGESIRKYLAVYAHFIAINVAVARRRTGDLGRIIAAAHP
jgi:hypothetical protein